MAKYRIIPNKTITVFPLQNVGHTMCNFIQDTLNNLARQRQERSVCRCRNLKLNMFVNMGMIEIRNHLRQKVSKYGMSGVRNSSFLNTVSRFPPILVFSHFIVHLYFTYLLEIFILVNYVVKKYYFYRKKYSSLKPDKIFKLKPLCLYVSMFLLPFSSYFSFNR